MSFAEGPRDARSEEEVRRSEALLAETQRLSLTGSFSWTVATDTVTWSDQLYRIYELEVGAPVTLELIRTRVHPDDVSLLEKMKVVDRAPEHGGEFEWRYRLMMPDRSTKYMHAVVRRTRDEHGDTAYIAAVQDVTKRCVSAPPAARPSATRHSDDATVAGKHSIVSIVDDDESVRESLPDLLRQLGFAAEAFSSAEAFLASDVVGDTSCLLLDVVMPGMSGPDLQRELADRGHAIPIVFVTATGDRAIRSRLMESGAVECLFKPFSESALVDALNAALGMK